MKDLLGTIAAVFLLSAASFAEVTKDDLKKLAAAQISDGVVLAYVRAHGPMPKLSAQDLIELKNAGVSEKVLEQLVIGDQKPAPAPLPTRVVERRVHVVPAPVVVGVPHVWYGPWRPWHPWVRIGICW